MTTMKAELKELLANHGVKHEEWAAELMLDTLRAFERVVARVDALPATEPAAGRTRAAVPCHLELKLRDSTEYCPSCGWLCGEHSQFKGRQA